MEKNWTLFWDMHSGGSLKEPPYDKIYIEISREVAERVFQAKFGHNPNRVTCTCCGEDYSISDYDTLEEASAYHRNCIWAEPKRPDNYNKLSFQEQCEWSKIHPGGWFESLNTVPNDWRTDSKSDKDVIPLQEYVSRKNIKVICANEITDAEKNTELGGRGYVWDD